MARRLRDDRYLSLYHVMNRGIARRTIFDDASDYRFFLAGLARAGRRGEVEVLAYALMRTHFHLILRSLGGLSTAMRRVQLRHARRFNRRHRRDGPLMRGRFLSKRIVSMAHEHNAAHYVHENPVVARLCETPGEYRWSSAWWAQRRRSPRWLSKEVLIAYPPWGSRANAPTSTVMDARAELVEACLKAPRDLDPPPLDGCTPARVAQWMRRKAELADGAASTLPAVGPRFLQSMLETRLAVMPGDKTQVPGAGTYPTRDLMLAGLLRSVSCLGVARIAASLAASPTRVRRLHDLHTRCIEQLPEYAELAATVVAKCLAMLHPGALGIPDPDRPE